MPSTAHDIGPLENFSEAQPHRVELDHGAVLIVRRGAKVYALRDRCPHQGARLSDGTVSGTSLPCQPGEEITYGKQGQIIACPWHGWEYDLTTGRSLVDPKRMRVRSYITQIKAGRVLVLLDHSPPKK